MRALAKLRDEVDGPTGTRCSSAPATPSTRWWSCPGARAHGAGAVHRARPGRRPGALLSTADVCLSPDPHNPLNDVSTMNKVLEYMVMGRPVGSFDLKEARVFPP
ncbi:hypothetical protein GCM10023238_06290 [Streptomyces heliomycini]